MKHIFLLIFAFAIQSVTIHAAEREGFSVKRDVAQYGGSDYANVVCIERGISLEQAFEIAQSNSDIDYFVYTKGGQMVLVIPSDVHYDPINDPFKLVSESNFIYDSGDYGHGYCRIFIQGDVVFFKKEGMWLGSASGLADAYFKEKSISE